MRKYILTVGNIMQCKASSNYYQFSLSHVCLCLFVCPLWSLPRADQYYTIDS